MDFITQLYHELDDVNNNNLNSPILFIFTGSLMLYISGIFSEIPLFIALICYTTVYVIYKYCLSNPIHILREILTTIVF